MFDEILSPQQKELIPFIEKFKREFYLVGGTAIALQVGHRQSIDFDLFKKTKINHSKINQRLKIENLDYQLLFSDNDSFHIMVNGVKITFFQYPFEISPSLKYHGIKMPDLNSLAAMKAYAIGRRAKWKDYVDLFFIFKYYHNFEEVSGKAKEIFGELFSPKLFRQQLCFFEDIDYTEEVSFINQSYDETEIKNYLTNLVTDVI